MAGRLVNALGAAAKTAEAFSDRATLGHMLRFEAALTFAVARAGLVPRKHVAVIEQACDPGLYDPVALAETARRNLTLTVAVVRALTAEVRKRDAAAAASVHWGATSQDLIDTAMVLQIGEAVPPLLEDLHGIDYQVMSPGLRGCVARAGIYKAQRFSDHAPLVVDYGL